MMNELRWPCQGLVLWHGQPLALTVSAPWLVGDPWSWAGELRERLGAEAQRTGHQRSAQDWAVMAQLIERWQALTAVQYSGFPLLDQRLEFLAAPVTGPNFGHYLGELVARSQPAPAGSQPQFILTPTGAYDVPTLYTDRSTPWSRHTGPEMLGVVLSRREFQQEILRSIWGDRPAQPLPTVQGRYAQARFVPAF